MKKKISKRAAIITVSFGALLLCMALAVGGISAYLTDIGSVLDNNFTIALGVSHVIVEKFPFNPDTGIATSTPEFGTSTDGTSAKFEKAVQVANTGYVDEYVRVKLEFTDSAIRDMTKFSHDGVNYYSANPDANDSYINHLPDGWVYNKNDGFYYYTRIVESGDWDKIEKTLTYDENQFRYFYKTNNSIIENNNIITVPLIRYVNSLFKDPKKDMKSYGIIVVAQSCPFYTGSNYADAWANYNPNDF